MARWGQLRDELHHQVGDGLNRGLGALEESNASLEGVLRHIDFNRAGGHVAAVVSGLSAPGAPSSAGATSASCTPRSCTPNCGSSSLPPVAIQEFSSRLAHLVEHVPAELACTATIYAAEVVNREDITSKDNALRRLGRTVANSRYVPQGFDHLFREPDDGDRLLRSNPSRGNRPHALVVLPVTEREVRKAVPKTEFDEFAVIAGDGKLSCAGHCRKPVLRCVVRFSPPPTTPQRIRGESTPRCG